MRVHPFCMNLAIYSGDCNFVHFITHDEDSGFYLSYALLISETRTRGKVTVTSLEHTLLRMSLSIRGLMDKDKTCIRMELPFP